MQKLPETLVKSQQPCDATSPALLNRGLRYVNEGGRSPLKYFLPAIFAMLVAGAAGAAAPDTPAEPPAPAGQAAQPATPAAKRGAPSARSAPSASEELKQKCATRMYGASPRGRNAVNWTVYDRCMKNGGRS